MRRLTFIVCVNFSFICLAISNCLYSQNLVFNGNFEDVNYCTELNLPCSPAAWFYVNGEPYGYHKHKDPGNYRNYALAFGAFGNSIHEYWETKLGDKLMTGKEYILSFEVNELNSDLGNYGFLFTDKFIFSACDTVLTSAAYISMAEGKTKQLKSGWIHIEKKFYADKEFQHLIIGKFGDVNVGNVSHRFAFDNLKIEPVRRYSIPDKSLKDSLYGIRHRHNYPRKCGDNKTALPPPTPVEKKVRIDSIVLDDIKFGFNNYTILNPEVVEKFKSNLSPENITMVIVYGYTDSIGSEEYNLKLSQMRADAVKQLLMNHYSIPEAVITATGKGISREYSDMSKNRRVEIFIYHKVR